MFVIVLEFIIRKKAVIKVKKIIVLKKCQNIVYDGIY